MKKKFEIERKYLVADDSYKNLSINRFEIAQGYLNRDPHRTVRVRRKGEKGYITIKGLTSGIKREEYEYEIPLQDALHILAICEKEVISKTRWIVPFEGYQWEVDEFHSHLEGLTIAEIELDSECENPPLPPFIGEEVSDDPRYFNSSLSKMERPPINE